ncbi:hypothetical protein P43SY_008021 [Pythium insidiosum]|uniref:EF-hand domain-containing protein n=1 Tax=Pythium insidiosum TaxID=114742 RepID=A0AAD5LN78_PYTIN|nr:hypothetical protein P43SY_008021 [Pythium insidiosum]
MVQLLLLALAVVVALTAVVPGLGARVDVASDVVTLVLPLLLDFQLVLLPVDVGKAPSVAAQVARFCSAHGIVGARCHVVHDAVRQVADLDSAAPCRRIDAEGLPAFARIRNILFPPRKASTKSAFRTVTFEWSQIETAQVVDSACDLVTATAAADACAAALAPALDHSFEWIRSLGACSDAVEDRYLVLSDVAMPTRTAPNSPEVSQRIAAVERLIASLSAAQAPVTAQVVDPISGVSVTSLDPRDAGEIGDRNASSNDANSVGNASTEPQSLSIRRRSPQILKIFRNMSQNLTAEELAEFREIFNLVDRDRGGSITKVELGELMDTLGIDTSPEEIDLMIHEIDQDSNGEIDFDEFVAVMSRKVNATYTSEQVKNAFRAKPKN